jgi:hypothetical protein
MVGPLNAAICYQLYTLHIQSKISIDFVCERLLIVLLIFRYLLLSKSSNQLTYNQELMAICSVEEHFGCM